MLVSGEGGVDGGMHVASQEGIEEEREERRGCVPGSAAAWLVALASVGGDSETSDGPQNSF